MQVPGAVQDTPFSPSAWALAGLGVGSIVQVVPSHSSATAEVSAFPAAVQVVAVVHDTDCRIVSVAAAGLGVGWIVHCVPFQRSASVSSTGGLTW